MLFNTSYKTSKLIKTINKTVGQPLTLAKRKLIGGATSPPLLISKCSVNIHNLLIFNKDICTCTLEIRPKGLIVNFNAQKDLYAMVIPYYQLSIIKSAAGEYSIHMGGTYIKVLVSGIGHDFMEKVLTHRAANIPEKPKDL
ncbi:hypothetical protein [Neptunitalea lumnitzerae]|uniref:Uncharacterized protein n=1 Tax=Neptunitalea lumnitzerae TaxID=2965509 RepID=A0ABQ5MIU8_9FLAO|nr:hypothetical protein [Neptunitalea sp. Y10]GLB48867.1 hypothetical protein Y10_12350 [Neptunitalea sp. Y10]